MENNKNLQAENSNNGCLKFIVGFALLIWYIMNYSNPVTQVLGYRTVSNLIDEKYPGYEIKSQRCDVWGYNDGLLAVLEKPGSPDSKFYIRTDFGGKVISDTYERDIVQKRNVDTRLHQKYTDMINQFLPKALAGYGRVHLNMYFADMPEEELVMDKQYSRREMEELSLKYGKIIMVFPNGITADEKFEVVQAAKAACVENNMGFYTIEIDCNFTELEEDYITEWYLIE